MEYDKLTQREHILQRNEIYVGSIKLGNKEKFHYIADENKVVKKEIEISDAIERIFLEVLMNSADNVLRSREFKYKPGEIHITIDETSISVYNEGFPITTNINKKHNILTPEMIFFNLMSGSNFNDDGKRKMGGKNGLGAKLTAVFSTKFELEIGNNDEHTSYKQYCTDNMNEISEAKIERYHGHNYTKITFYPDLERFRMKSLLPLIPVFHYYSLGVSFTKDVSVTFNGKKYHLNIYDFASLFGFKDGGELVQTDDSNVLIFDAPDNGEVVSFVNSIPTLGGNHVKGWLNFILTELGLDIKTYRNQFKKNIFMIVDCLLVEPDFTSQSKTELTSPNPTFAIKKAVIKRISNWQAVNIIKDNKKMKILSANDGKKSKYVVLDKLKDADEAGGKLSHKCTLYVTEGDSALGSAIRAISDRKFNGFFPLKGKPLNTSKTTDERYASNKEISSIKLALGIKEGEDYSNGTKKLRYGQIIMFADQDPDGQHIKGLFYNIFRDHYKSLIQSGFIKTLESPLVKAEKGKQVFYFYSTAKFEEWISSHQNFKISYFKGIGSLGDEELSYVFANPKVISLEYDEKADDSLSLAFDKKREDDRKQWINSYDSNHNEPKTITQFVNSDLVSYSVESVNRMISSVYDGLKQTQRKILFTSIEKCKTKWYKVSELQGLVGGKTSYHHGESSLTETIFNMGRNYIGSNNVPLLEGKGNFGTRMGNDSAQARYPSVKLHPIVPFIFKSEDDIILEYEMEGDKRIEPKNYYPIIPMWLVNGCEGIATGYSHFITPRNPFDVITYIESWLSDDELSLLSPYFFNYKGKISEEDGRYYSEFNIKKYKVGKYKITEIPINMTISQFESKLASYVQKEQIVSYKNLSYGFESSRCKDVQPLFKIKCEPGKKLPFNEKVIIRDDNVNLLVKNGKCKEFDHIYDALNHYCSSRLRAYNRRIKKQIEILQEELEIEILKVRYIEDIISEKLVIKNKSDKKLYEEMEDRGYPEDFINMPMKSLTKSKIEDHRKKISEIKQKISTLKSSNAKDVWLMELATLKTKLKEILV